ncbi:PGF-CTERM sorting domain-containing protein [Halostella litorea]|uniref:PGF-CTERM sorting domain-containing protein n=1 Tax=Halostella litorea TaxID=2528831 RepID=UPI0010930F54|nr:PGF-CTERM sorting domain-containing protein [Halostella litorea]
MGKRKTVWFAVALAALLVTSSVGAVAMGPNGSAASTAQEEETTDTADEVYVDGNGDAVLVYRNSSEDSSTNGHLGADLSEGLFYVFLNDTIEEPPEENFAGNATFILDPESVSASGAFSMTQPESIEDLAFDASLTQTRETSAGSMSLDATFVDQSSSSTGASTYGEVSTEGTMTTTASSFHTDGTVTVTPTDGQSLPSSSQMSQEFSIQETDDGYTLSAAQDYVVGSYTADRWNTRENATRSLEAQFEGVAQQLDGDAQVTVDSYSYDDAENRLDIEYTVEFTGVDEAVSEQLATSLSSARDLDLSESEARDLADRIQSVELSELSASVDVQSDGATVNWNVRLDEYDEAARATLDILEASEMNTSQMDIDAARSRLDAQQAAELQQTVTWDGTVSVPDAQTATVQFEAESSTENWQAYVSELEDRGVEWQGDTTMEMHAETQNGELTASGSATFSQEGLLDNAIDSALQNAEDSPAAENEQARSFLRAFQQSEFEKARMDASVGDGTVTFEAGASFENVSAFRDVMSEAYGEDVAIESAVATMEDGDSVTYVRMPGAVGSDASESDVRELSMVGEDTEVHMPDDWDPDERDFPQPDNEEARNYLGIENDDSGNGDDGGDDDDESSSSLPGFGPVVALVALAAVALIARRRAA